MLPPRLKVYLKQQSRLLDTQFHKTSFISPLTLFDGLSAATPSPHHPLHSAELWQRGRCRPSKPAQSSPAARGRRAPRARRASRTPPPSGRHARGTSAAAPAAPRAPPRHRSPPAAGRGGGRPSHQTPSLPFSMACVSEPKGSAWAVESSKSAGCNHFDFDFESEVLPKTLKAQITNPGNGKRNGKRGLLDNGRGARVMVAASCYIHIGMIGLYQKDVNWFIVWCTPLLGT